MTKFLNLLLRIAPMLIWAVLLLSACGQKEDPGQNPEAEVTEYAAGDTVLVSGILLDTRCFAASKQNYGIDHPEPVPTSQEGPACARYCAMQGFPVGLATAGRNGPVWMLLSTPPVLADYMAQYVRISGVVRSKGVLTPERIEMKSGNDWIFVM
jgi:hypothetical protein